MLIVTVILSGCALIVASDEEFTQYGKWQTYSPTQALHYPDFDLVLNDEPRRVKYIEGLPLGREYHFTISSSNSRISVFWSSGTGDIGPSTFEIDGKKFFLEMIMSDYLNKPISDKQIVIWPESDFYKRKGRWLFW
jgi:hypothetical protein